MVLRLKPRKEKGLKMIYVVLYNSNDIEIDRHELNEDFSLTDILQMWSIYIGDTIKIESDNEDDDWQEIN